MSIDYSIDNVGIGIVTFNPNVERLIENIENIKRQVKKIIIFDNGSANFTDISAIVNKYDNVHLISEGSNLGIAYALNVIMQSFDDNGYEWVLTLDQDSVIDDNAVSKYLEFISKTKINKIGIISPVIVDRNSQSVEVEIKDEYIILENCITSGSFTNVDAWKKVGMFDSKMFIDWVDFEFCKRLEDNSYTILRLNSVVILHEIGNITRHKFFFKYIETQNHSPFRKKYIVQNILYFNKKHPSRFGTLKSYFRIMKLAISVILYEDNKKRKLSSMYKGYINYKKL